MTVMDDKIKDFVSSFVVVKVNAGTWPEKEVERIVMMNELLTEWENQIETGAINEDLTK